MIEKYKELLGNDLEHYDDHSIYNSELYVFWKFAQKYKVTRILESGTYLGSSARRLKKVFPGCEIITYESDRAHYKRCKKIKGVKHKFGELKGRLKLINKNTAILIDGPKRKIATRLARQCLRRGALFVGIHDMNEYISYLKKKFKTVVHSGNQTDEEKTLDKGVKNPHSLKGYYGTVLAVLCNK